MWHHSFDPHTMVNQIRAANLKPPPQAFRSRTVQQFLETSSVSANLVKSALENPIISTPASSQSNQNSLSEESMQIDSKPK